MKPSDIHFGKSLNENSIIDKLFGKKVTLINSIEDPNQKQEAELEKQREILIRNREEERKKRRERETYFY